MLRVRRTRPASHRRALGDLAVTGVAAAVVAGAWLALPLAWPHGLLLGVAACGAALALRRPYALAAGAFLLASALAAHAAPASSPRAPFAALVTLRTDPSGFGRGVAAEAVSSGRHLELRAFGGPARRLRAALAGQQVMVEGRVGPLGRRDSWLRSRHIVGLVEVRHVSIAGDGSPLARSANRVRRQLVQGARTMDPLDRSLYLGFVIGDDREQPARVVDEFRGSGLSHLTAVSGENVAFLLAVTGPALRRLRPTARWGATLLVIGWFAAITRFEPSVIRASVMAAFACTAIGLGRPARTTSLLSLTVIGVLLADPLLVESVGWWLSVGATTGIALLGAPLAARLPGPASIRAGMAVTIAAQLGVAPVSVAVFGPLPLAALPANVLAAPAAGPVMIYGLPAGLLASTVPNGLARALQVPTVILVRWIARVAGWTSAWPLPRLGGPGLFVAAVAVACLLRRPPRHGHRSRL
jgi:competence protein ComEC